MKNWKGKYIIIASIITIVILVITIFSTIIAVNQKMTQYCFEELSSTSKELAKDLNNMIHIDRAILSAIANIISGYDNIDNKLLCSIMNSIYAPNTFISYYEILTPDGKMLKQDGTQIDISSSINFNEEIKKGAYISEKEKDLFQPDDMVVRNAVPVYKNNEVIAMLYGTISLTKLAKLYTTDIYNGQAYVYLEDGTSGDFLLDTWHKTLGNIIDFENRKTLRGYSFEKAIEDLRNGKSGKINFVSSISGKTIYLYYEPVGINNWNVMVSIDASSAFMKTNAISSILYNMSFIISITLIFYMIFLIINIIKIYKKMHKLDTEDKNTGLQNRTAYDTYMLNTQQKQFDTVTCIFIDVNELHATNNMYGHDTGDKMLQIVANALKKQFSYDSLFRIGGDEFIAICENSNLDICNKKIKEAAEEIEKNEFTISYGIVCRTNEIGLDQIIKEADKKMFENKRIYYQTHNAQRYNKQINDI